MIGNDRHFRSSTTKSGSSSHGQYRRSEGHNKHGASTEDDEDNFLNLEWEENLYDERLNADMYVEEEKVVVNSKIKTSIPADKCFKRHQSREKRIVTEKVDDTIPDFGFVENKENELEIPAKVKPQKEPIKSKIILNKPKDKNKNHKKLKIKVWKSKNNENKNPFSNLNSNNDKKEHMLVEDNEDEDGNGPINIDQAMKQYIPDWLLYNNDNTDQIQNTDFLFGHLECNDNFDEVHDENHQFSNVKDNVFMDESSANEYYGMNSAYDEFRQEMDMKEQQINDQNDEAEAAAKMLNYLISSEAAYAPDPSYFQTSQFDVSNVMRAILVDWMMEVCSEYTLKRETFHYAVNYVDRFLSIHPNVLKEELQLIGVSSMFIAAKIEEVYSPRVADFAKSTDNGYNVTQIINMEKVILRELQWKTTPPTYAMWVNWYMHQWDIYITSNEFALSNPIVQTIGDLTFKSSNETAYARYREVMQIMDLIVLDHRWLQYKPRGLVASIMFLLLGIHTGDFHIEMIWSEFIYTSSGFLDINSNYKQLFIDFLYLSFGFHLNELAPTIQYVSMFMNIPFNYDLPIYAQQKNSLEENYEEFLSFQTHHPLGLEFAKQLMSFNN